MPRFLFVSNARCIATGTAIATSIVAFIGPNAIMSARTEPWHAVDIAALAACAICTSFLQKPFSVAEGMSGMLVGTLVGTICLTIFICTWTLLFPAHGESITLSVEFVIGGLLVSFVRLYDVNVLSFAACAILIGSAIATKWPIAPRLRS